MIWSRCNSIVKSWILNSASKQIYKSILRFNDTFEIWNDLSARFHIMNLPRSYEIVNLYVLDTTSLPEISNEEPLLFCSNVIVDSALWHNKLGHPSMIKTDSLYDVLGFKPNKKVIIILFAIFPNKSISHMFLIIIYVTLLLICCIWTYEDLSLYWLSKDTYTSLIFLMITRESPGFIYSDAKMKSLLFFMSSYRWLKCSIKQWWKVLDQTMLWNFISQSFLRRNKSHRITLVQRHHSRIHL